MQCTARHNSSGTSEESFKCFWCSVTMTSFCLIIARNGERRGSASLTELGLTDVDQHVRVGAVAHREVIIVSAVVVLYGLLLGAP